METDQETTRAGRRKCPSCGLDLASSVIVCPRDGTQIQTSINIDPAFANYDFLASIGEGGMGVIYKARHKHLNKIVAIKTLHSHLTNPDLIRRFHIEGKAASILSHPNIIAVQDFGLTKTGQPYMIMDYVDGQTLSDGLRHFGQLPMQQFLPIFLQVCDALSHAHKRAVLHRDVKPSNIMLIRNNRNEFDIRIMDFGIAKLMNESEMGAQNLTKTGDAIGSPIYMSPEQARGGKMDHRSDLYSLGCVMYEALTGSPPFCGNTALDTMMMHIDTKPLPLSQASLGMKIDSRVEHIIMRLLEKEQEDRYQSMDELREDLITLQNPDATKVLPSVGDARGSAKAARVVQKTSNKSPLILWGSIGGALLLTVTIFLVFKLLGPTQEASPQDSQSTETQAQKPSAPKTYKDPEAAATKTFDDYGDARKGLIEQVEHNSQNIAVSWYDDPQKVQDSDLSILKKASLATLISLKGLLITDRGLDNIKDLKSVKKLICNQTKVKTLRGITKLPLTELQSANTQLLPEAYAHIGEVKSLKLLDLAHTPIQDSDLAKLFGLKDLEQINLVGCSNLTVTGVDKLKNAIPGANIFARFGTAAVAAVPDDKSKKIAAPKPMKMLQNAKDLLAAGKWNEANEKITETLEVMPADYNQETQTNANILKGDCLQHDKLPLAAGFYYNLAAKTLSLNDPRVPRIYDKVAVGYEAAAQTEETTQSAITARERASEFFDHNDSPDTKSEASQALLRSNLDMLYKDYLKLHQNAAASRTLKTLINSSDPKDTVRKKAYEKVLAAIGKKAEP